MGLAMIRPIFILTRDSLVRQRGLEMLKEHVVVDRLRQICVCPALKRPASAHRIVERGHDDHRHRRPHGLEPLEQFDASDTRHADIGDQAIETAGCIGCEERFSPVEDLTRATHDLKEVGEGITDGLVVIHDCNNRWLGQADAFAVTALGPAPQGCTESHGLITIPRSRIHDLSRRSGGSASHARISSPTEATFILRMTLPR
jgi:hypothetical protein